MYRIRCMIDDMPLGLLTFIATNIPGIFLKSWSLRKKVVYSILLVISSFSITVLFLKWGIMGVLSLILIVMFIGAGYFLYREEIRFIIKNHKMKYHELIRDGLTENAEEARKCAQGLSTSVCGLAEECTIATLSGDTERAIEIFRDQAEIINHIKKNGLVHYLRLAIEEYEPGLSRVLEKHARDLLEIPTILN